MHEKNCFNIAKTVSYLTSLTILIPKTSVIISFIIHVHLEIVRPPVSWYYCMVLNNVFKLTFTSLNVSPLTGYFD